jgi:hypothetical protein
MKVGVATVDRISAPRMRRVVEELDDQRRDHAADHGADDAVAPALLGHAEAGFRMMTMVSTIQ